MRKIHFIGLFVFLFLIPVNAQKFIQIKDKSFNWGGKVGFSATLPVINSLTINDIEAKNISQKYKVGFLAAAFARINIDRFFIQPSLSWRYAEGDIRFTIPLASTTAATSTVQENSKLEYKTTSLEIPIMIGYYIVKQGPYALSLMVGPNLKYNYKNRYSASFVETPSEYISESTPYGINIATGIGVSIWRLFFDFTYEFGLNEVESNFREIKTNTTQTGLMSIDKRTNVMSFSLGFLF